MLESVEGSVPEPLAHVSLDAIAATATAPSESTLSVILTCQTAGSLSPRERVHVKMIGSPGKGSNLTACVPLVDARGSEKGWSKRRPWAQTCIQALIAVSRGRR